MASSDYIVEDDLSLWIPVDVHDKALVREQMERLLETSHFRNSRRYPALLRFIIEESLEGRGEFLKERWLGVKVFGRPGDYDTAADPVVRVTIAEIRKRIAQYYHDKGHSSELRIDLPPGHYTPEFRLPADARHLLMETAGTVLESQPEPAPRFEEDRCVVPFPVPAYLVRPSLLRRHISRVAAGLAACVLALGVLLAWPSIHPSALDQFWAPILNAHKTVMVCIPVAGGKYGTSAKSEAPVSLKISAEAAANEAPGSAESYLALESLGENAVFSDVRALMSVSGLLSKHNVEQRLRLNTSFTFDDLRQGPAILIGGMDNQWTLRAISHQRYRFGGSDEQGYFIYDTSTGKPTPWVLDVKAPITGVTRDYAIIARLHEEDSSRAQVIVAGIGMGGTAAAGELLSDPAQMEELRRRVGKDFAKRDFEAVISTDLVNGIAGAPKILTVDLR